MMDGDYYRPLTNMGHTKPTYLTGSQHCQMANCWVVVGFMGFSPLCPCHSQRMAMTPLLILNGIETVTESVADPLKCHVTTEIS